MNSSSNFVSQQEPARGEARASSMNGSGAGGAAAQQQTIMGFAEPVPMLAQARFSKTFGVDHDVDVEIGMETADVHFEMKGMESLNRNFCPDAKYLKVGACLPCPCARASVPLRRPTPAPLLTGNMHPSLIQTSLRVCSTAAFWSTGCAKSGTSFTCSRPPCTLRSCTWTACSSWSRYPKAGSS